MLPTSSPDRIGIAFDNDCLVDHAGLLFPATLAGRLGLPDLAVRYLDLGDAPGRANAGDKLLTLVASALAGGDCIADADALRAGGTASVLGCTVKAPSTLGVYRESLPGAGPHARARLARPRRSAPPSCAERRLLAPALPRHRPADAGTPAELSGSTASRPLKLRSVDSCLPDLYLYLCTGLYRHGRLVLSDLSVPSRGLVASQAKGLVEVERLRTRSDLGHPV